MKSRSSTGVGQKIDLEYNIETMRITDPGIDESENRFGNSASSIMNQIKANSTPKENEVTEKPKFERPTGTPVWEQGPKIKVETDGNKLKSMLAGIRNESKDI